MQEKNKKSGKYIMFIILLLISVFFIHQDQLIDIYNSYYLRFANLYNSCAYLLTISIYKAYFYFIHLFAGAFSYFPELDKLMASDCKNFFELICQKNLNMNLIYSNALYMVKIFLTGVLLLFIFLTGLLFRKNNYSNRFWFVILNPIFFIVTFVYGRPEIFFLFFLFWSIFKLKDKKWIISIILFVLAIMTKVVAFYFLPLYLLYFYYQFKTKIDKFFNSRFDLKKIIGLALPLLVVIYLVLAFWSPIFNFVLLFFSGERVQDLLELKYSFAMDFNQDNPFNTHNIYIFFLGYILLFIYLIYKNKLSFNEYLYANVIVLLWYYSVALVPPQYYAWVIPFMALTYKDIKHFWKIHVFQLIPYVILFLVVGGRYLFIPYVQSKGINHLGNDIKVWELSLGLQGGFTDLGVFVSGLLFTMLVASCIFMIGLYIKQLIKNSK